MSEGSGLPVTGRGSSTHTAGPAHGNGTTIILSDWTKGYLRPNADLIHGH